MHILPGIPSFFNEKLLPLRIEQQIQQADGDTEDKGADKGMPEAVNGEAFDEPGGTVEQKTVNDEGEEPEGQDIDRQGKEGEEGFYKGVEQSEDQGGNGGSLPSVAVDAGNYVDSHDKAQAVQEPSHEKVFHWVSFPGEGFL
jgi:hypothetical protein